MIESVGHALWPIFNRNGRITLEIGNETDFAFQSCS